MTDWNPRYVAYAQAHNRSPEDQYKQDDLDWPGGRCVGFKLWMRPLIREFKLMSGPVGSVAYEGGITRKQDDFTAFLVQKAN